nr:hypothetical protein Ade03nite_23650 [Actinoplanes derwentensis]
MPRATSGEQLADTVDRMPVAEAARELATHPIPLVTLVLDLLGTRKAPEIQSALTELR